MKKQRRIAPQKQGSGMIALVNEYSQLLKNHLDGGHVKPNPQDFVDRYSRKGKEKELRMHLNLATILAVHGSIQREEAQKAVKNARKSIQRSKQKFFDQFLKKGQ